MINHQIIERERIRSSLALDYILCTASTAYIEMSTICAWLLYWCTYYDLRITDSSWFSRGSRLVPISTQLTQVCMTWHMAARPRPQHSMMSEQFKGFPDRYNSTFLVYIDPSPIFFINGAHLVDDTKCSLPPQPNGWNPTDIGAATPSWENKIIEVKYDAPNRTQWSDWKDIIFSGPHSAKHGEVDDHSSGSHDPFILREFVEMFLVIFAWACNVPQRRYLGHEKGECLSIEVF